MRNCCVYNKAENIPDGAGLRARCAVPRAKNPNRRGTPAFMCCANGTTRIGGVDEHGFAALPACSIFVFPTQTFTAYFGTPNNFTDEVYFGAPTS